VYSFNNYDERGRIIFRVSPCDVIFNTTEEFSCSFLNKFVTTYEYEGTSSRPYRITYPGGKREVFSYNETGQITSTLFGEGYCLKRDYNERHHLKKLYDESGFYIEYDYDQDFISAVTTPTSKVTHERKDNVLISTDGKGYKTSFVYDEWDRLAQIIDAEGGTTLFEYDDLNQLKKITFPNGSDRELDYNKLKQPIEEKLVLQILRRPNFVELQISA
jgi:YD repeat-containing protein